MRYVVETNRAHFLVSADTFDNDGTMVILRNGRGIPVAGFPVNDIYRIYEEGNANVQTRQGT